MNRGASAEVRIGVMSAEDLPAVFALEQRAYGVPWSLGMLRDCISAGHTGLTLRAEDALVGYAILSSAAGEAHLLNLAVEPGRQRCGYGARLLCRILDMARWHHAQVLLLEVRPSNTAALALYQRFGFAQIGRRPGYYPLPGGGREDALVLSRSLLRVLDEPDRVSAQV